jgi:glycosyltransferase involved in cell wall biosynthesis
VLYKGKSEFYKDIDITALKLSIFSRFISRIIRLFKKNYLKTTFELRIEAPSNELKHFFKSYQPDIVLLKAYQNLLAVKTLIIAKRYKTKILMLTQTNFTHIKGSEFLFRLNIKLFKFLKVHAYITPIKSNYNAFKNFGVKNVWYLPFVYPAKEIKFKKIIGQVKILSVGKFQKRKDQLLLLKAFNNLIIEKYDIKLCLIGEIADEEYFVVIRNFIVENSLTDYVCIKANVPYSQMQEEYIKHDIFILPSYNEPAAYSPVEAMANGLPVICSAENGTKCYINNAENGYIFKSKDEHDLAEKLEILLSDKEKLFEISKNALLSSGKNHHPENFAKAVMEIISI